jgi:hypothetical protein
MESTLLHEPHLQPFLALVIFQKRYFIYIYIFFFFWLGLALDYNPMSASQVAEIRGIYYHTQIILQNRDLLTFLPGLASNCDLYFPVSCDYRHESQYLA